MGCPINATGRFLSSFNLAELDLCAKLSFEGKSLKVNLKLHFRIADEFDSTH